MSTRLLAAIGACVLAIAALPLDRTSAGDLGLTWDDPCLTHSGPAELDALVGDALSEWGSTSAVRDCGQGADITIQWATPQEERHDATAWALPHGFASDPPPGYVIGRMNSCEIFVSERGRPLLVEFEDMAASLVGHEVGHCLGLDHPEPAAESIMSLAYGGWFPDDRAAIRALYPPTGSYRLVVPGLAAD